jgi:hypothetical protein
MARDLMTFMTDEPDGLPTDYSGGGGELPPPEAPPPEAPPPAAPPTEQPPAEQPAPPPAPRPLGPPPATPTGGAAGQTGQSAVGGVQASDVTGGVQGTFGQAGTADFSRRFGSSGQDAPATWFRRQANPGANAQANLNRVTGGQTAGGQGPAAPAIANSEDAGGSPQDEEWQRFMNSVMAQRFGVGGRR